MTPKILSMIMFGVALATLAASVARADDCPECLIYTNGAAANTLMAGQTG